MSTNFLKHKRRKFFFDELRERQKTRLKLARKRRLLKKKPIYRFFKTTRSAFNPKLQDLFYSRLVRYKICIRVKQNNIFCTFRNIKKNKTLLVASAGKLKIKITKKTFKFLNKRLIQKFLNKIFNFAKKKSLFIIVELIAPIRSRRFIVKYFSFLLKEKCSLFFCFKPVKCFNGCKPKKKKRKKQKKFRLFK